MLPINKFGTDADAIHPNINRDQCFAVESELFISTKQSGRVSNAVNVKFMACAFKTIPGYNITERFKVYRLRMRLRSFDRYNVVFMVIMLIAN